MHTQDLFSLAGRTALVTGGSGYAGVDRRRQHRLGSMLSQHLVEAYRQST